MIAKLTSFFGILALVLASIGLYGVTAYSVERRTSEIGIRMALGADRLSVLRLVLRGAFLQVGIGLAIGIPVAILGGHAMASQLFGVKPYDPVVLSITLLVLCTAAFLAALVPARIAAGIGTDAGAANRVRVFPVRCASGPCENDRAGGDQQGPSRLGHGNRLAEKWPRQQYDENHAQLVDGSHLRRLTHGECAKVANPRQAGGQA